MMTERIKVILEPIASFRPRRIRSFSEKGDSGVWIMDREEQVVGMVWGGSRWRFDVGSTESVFVSYATPVNILFHWIGREFLTAAEARGMKFTDEEKKQPGSLVKVCTHDM